MSKECHQTEVEDISAMEDEFLFEVQYAISTVMTERGVSQANLAKAMGVSSAYVSNLLNNPDRNMSAKTIAKVFALLGDTGLTLSSNILSATRAKLHQSAMEDAGPQKEFCEAASGPVSSITEARACRPVKMWHAYVPDCDNHMPSAVMMDGIQKQRRIS